MDTDETPLDDKAKRMRDLLASFYSPIPSASSNPFSKHSSRDDINSASFQPDQYMNILARKSNLEGLLQRHVQMVAEIKNLDTDLQMLVYENYNKFICATDTIKRMKSNILGMEANMEQLLEKIMSVQSRSDSVNTSLCENREHIEKMHRTCNLLRKIQAYGDSSFQDCKRASEEAIAIIVKNLQVDNLKAKLLEKLELSLTDIQFIPEVMENASPSAHEVLHIGQENYLLKVLKRDGAEEYSLELALDASMKVVFNGGRNVLLYINMRSQRISLLLKKRFATPNWVKHKEPREVHMFVDLFLQELKITGNEVKQILPQDKQKHRRADSNGSTASSRSNSFRDEKLSRSNIQKGRSQQLLETHLAKLFKQKVEIFTKVEYTQESVVMTTVKLCLKSLQEFVRLQTFNRSGFQQIQLDIQFLRTPLKEIVEDEAAMDFLLDEVIVAAVERCLDPIPLEPPILDKLIQAKLAKHKEHDIISS
ncbi:Vacuolar protein sorting-associated protein 51-like [Spatholobus suberectus]|nr:Vacuolar protein sorting-associated protein 51-like [Spatholobus suberectus]